MVMHPRPRQGIRKTLAEVLPPRPSWADLADSSNEAASQDRTLPPLHESSYDAAALGVDSSRDGLNRRLADSVQIKSSPKDFSFLLSNIVGKVDSDGPNTSQTAGNMPSDESSSIARPLNSSAQEILAPLLQPSPPTDGSSPNESLSVIEEVAGASEMQAPPKRTRKKRALSQIEVPAMKRTRDRDESASSTDVRTSIPIPEASEEEWHHRILKRERAVNTIKASKEYHLFLEVRPRREDRLDGEPSTPEAQDRNTSKRRWEYEVQQWRAGLKQWCQDHVGDRVQDEVSDPTQSLADGD